MASALPKVDESTRWGACAKCGATHRRLVVCPPPLVWLVLTLCRNCDALTGHYCSAHRGRRG